jgi:uncharacterized membrane-anchored protein
MKRLLPALLVVCLLQWTVPLGLIWQHQATLRTGTVYRFRTAPVDPVDPFRGRYVQLRFEAAQLPSSPLAWPEDGSPLFAPVTTDADGDARLGTPVPQPPEQGDWLPVRLHHRSDTATWVTLPFDRYYLNEHRAPAVERQFRDAGVAARAYAEVRVRNGHAVIQALVLPTQ